VALCAPLGGWPLENGLGPEGRVLYLETESFGNFSDHSSCSLLVLLLVACRDFENEPVEFPSVSSLCDYGAKGIADVLFKRLQLLFVRLCDSGYRYPHHAFSFSAERGLEDLGVCFPQPPVSSLYPARNTDDEEYGDGCHRDHPDGGP